MKKMVIIGLIAVSSVVFTGCGGKEEKKDSDQPVQESVAEVTGADATAGIDESKDQDKNAEDGISPLSTEDGGISISIARPEGFEDVEYSSEQQVAFQRIGADGISSTQINLRLMSEDENTVITTAQQEVEYIMSANVDERETSVGEIQTLAEGERQWSYFSYSLADEEGYRLWTTLSNGCILSCAVVNIGSGLEPLSVESLVPMLSAAIQE